MARRVSMDEVRFYLDQLVQNTRRDLALLGTATPWTARIGTRSMSPHLLKSGSGSLGMPSPVLPPLCAAVMMRLACAFTSSSETRPFGPVPAT